MRIEIKKDHVIMHRNKKGGIKLSLVLSQSDTRCYECYFQHMNSCYWINSQVYGVGLPCTRVSEKMKLRRGEKYVFKRI